jgi:competence protein ComEA
MEEEELHVRYLIVMAAVLCALIIGYNAFYVPDAAMTQIIVTTDISSYAEEAYTPQSSLEASAVLGTESASGKQSSGTSPLKNTGGKININTATAQQLSDGLDGIGAVMANRIVAYRQKNGGFKTIEEIKKVSGIGEKTFEKLKNAITV